MFVILCGSCHMIMHMIMKFECKILKFKKLKKYVFYQKPRSLFFVSVCSAVSITFNNSITKSYTCQNCNKIAFAYVFF